MNRALRLLPLVLLPALAAAGPSPAARRWWSHVEALASDAMEGRDTGSAGHERAAAHVAARFAALGVQPGGDAGFLQQVPLLSRRVVKERSRIALVRDGQEQPLRLDEDVILGSRTGRSGHVDAGLVFVGYGLSIPEAGYDDLAGLDLQGKVLVVLNGGSPPGVPASLAAHASAPAQRAEALARAGAVGLVTVSHPRIVELPWDRAVAGSALPVMMLAEPALQELADLSLVAQLRPERLDGLLAGTGHTFASLLALADAGKPLPHFPLPVSVRADVVLETARLSSPNVVGRVPGTDPTLAGETVVVSAHLDHVGVGAPVQGDAIYNGAMDNASGVAALLEVAWRLQDKKLRPRRTVLLVAFTAEEKGLLGSRWFVTHPPPGTGRMVADFTLDTFLPLIPLRRLVAQGLGESSLATPLRQSASARGIEVLHDPQPERNLFVRGDQYSFIREGIPALAFKFGFLPGSKEERTLMAWYRTRYHAPSDDLSQPVDREAAARFLDVLVDLVVRVGNAPERPQWNADSFFRRFARPEPPAPAP